MDPDTSGSPAESRRIEPSATEIQNWLVEQIASELHVPRERIQVDEPILSYGIDSMQIVVIVARLEDWLGFRFSGNPLEDHPTIESLSLFVAQRDASKAGPHE